MLKFFRRKKAVYVMVLGAFGIITTEFGVIGLLPVLSRDLGVSIGSAGWLLSGFALVIAIAGPFAVMLTSQVNRKTMMCLVLLLFVLSNLVSAFSTGFTMLMIARIIPAVIHPVFWAVAIVAAAKQEDEKESTRAVAIVTGGISTATVLGVPLAASSLNISFSNAGIALGTFLGGLVIASVGIHQVIWISVAFLLTAFLLSYASKDSI